MRAVGTMRAAATKATAHSLFVAAHRLLSRKNGIDNVPTIMLCISYYTVVAGLGMLQPLGILPELACVLQRTAC